MNFFRCNAERLKSTSAEINGRTWRDLPWLKIPTSIASGIVEIWSRRLSLVFESSSQKLLTAHLEPIPELYRGLTHFNPEVGLSHGMLLGYLSQLKTRHRMHQVN